MENFKGGSLEIIVNKSGNETKMIWKGKSDDRNPASMLDPYFTKIMDELKGTDVTVDFMELDYMNSSTVPPIIKFLKNLNSHKIDAVFTYSEKSKWQAASFKAFKTFSSMLPHITVEGK